ncbi:hypothetical protein PHMEG_0009412 [Phytophthora megakarya]|uniref:Uncharacterized protein n=1 Tax=Phytophthora megakarya TaxID=4795 RepID=A0A225WIC2_9STRA|nr:hypothetical protein PHMEG_0009412 [Phytophthora megakarya]
MWCDKLLTHVQTLDQVYEQGLLERRGDQPRAHRNPEISVEGKCPKKRQRLRLSLPTLGEGSVWALLYVFMSGLPDQVSKMNPCDIWKELEQKFGLSDAGAVTMLRRQ